MPGMYRNVIAQPGADYATMTPEDLARQLGVSLDQARLLAPQISGLGLNNQGNPNPPTPGPNAWNPATGESMPTPGQPSPRWAGNSGAFANPLPPVNVPTTPRLGGTGTEGQRSAGNQAMMGQQPADTSGAANNTPTWWRQQSKGYLADGGAFPVSGPPTGVDTTHVEFMGTPGEKVIVVPNGVDPMQFIRAHLPQAGGRGTMPHLVGGYNGTVDPSGSGGLGGSDPNQMLQALVSIYGLNWVQKMLESQNTQQNAMTTAFGMGPNPYTGTLEPTLAGQQLGLNATAQLGFNPTKQFDVGKAEQQYAGMSPEQRQMVDRVLQPYWAGAVSENPQLADMSVAHPAYSPALGYGRDQAASLQQYARFRLQMQNAYGPDWDRVQPPPAAAPQPAPVNPYVAAANAAPPPNMSANGMQPAMLARSMDPAGDAFRNGVPLTYGTDNEGRTLTNPASVPTDPTDHIHDIATQAMRHIVKLNPGTQTGMAGQYTTAMNAYPSGPGGAGFDTTDPYLAAAQKGYGMGRGNVGQQTSNPATYA